MRNFIAALTLLATWLLIGGCAGTGPGSAYTDRPAEDSARGNGYVIQDGQLDDAHRSVLAILVGRVPNMRVNYSGPCPAISLRGRIAQAQRSNPVVYLDGTRAENTCILDGIRASDLDRVEIYPTGVTTRPGYVTSAHGLILLFSREA